VPAAGHSVCECAAAATDAALRAARYERRCAAYALASSTTVVAAAAVAAAVTAISACWPEMAWLRVALPVIYARRLNHSLCHLLPAPTFPQTSMAIPAPASLCSCQRRHRAALGRRSSGSGGGGRGRGQRHGAAAAAEHPLLASHAGTGNDASHRVAGWGAHDALCFSGAAHPLALALSGLP